MEIVCHVIVYSENVHIQLLCHVISVDVQLVSYCVSHLKQVLTYWRYIS